MKRRLSYFILLCITGLFISPVKAQQKIAPADIKKIILNCGYGGMHSNTDVQLEVLNEQGKWNSYQTAVKIFEEHQPESNFNSIERSQTGTLSANQIVEFLNCIAVTKPQFDLKELNISPATLIAELKKTAKDTANNTIQLGNFITEANLLRAMTYVMKDVSVDTYNNCRIRIIKSNNDTLKIQTDHCYATMLPWTINKVNTYNMGINEFFIAAMGNRNYPNKDMLSLYDLKDGIYRLIDANYAVHPINTYRVNYCYTDNMKLLKANFKDVTIGKNTGFNNKYDLTLVNDIMPANMSLYNYTNLEDRTAILAIIHYSELIKQYLKRDNFVLKYYSALPQYHISFSFFWNTWINMSIEKVKKNIPSLKNIDADNVLFFDVSIPGKFFSEDMFFLLPDNRAVMAHRYLNKPDTTFKPIFPPEDQGANGLNSTIKYVLFNADGTAAK